MSDKSNQANKQQQQQSGAEASSSAQVDVSAVSWDEGSVQKAVMSRKMNSHRRVDYQVEGIGQVTEEWTISLTTVNDQTQEVAIHSVYVDGKLVRQVDLKTKQAIKKEVKYEPYNFLRYGTDGSTEQQQETSTDMVPIRGSAPADEDKPGGTGGSANATEKSPSGQSKSK